MQPSRSVVWRPPIGHCCWGSVTALAVSQHGGDPGRSRANTNDGKKSLPVQVGEGSLRDPHYVFKGAEVKNFLFRMLRLYPALVKIRFMKNVLFVFLHLMYFSTQ